jgi:hypothetical protein
MASRVTRPPYGSSLIVLFLVAMLAVLVGGSRPLSAAPAGLPFAPGEVLVRFKPEASALRRSNAMAAVGARVREQVRTAAMARAGDPGWHLVETRADVLAAVNALRQNPAVEHAQPNYAYAPSVANDPAYTSGSLWGMYGATTTPANQFGSHAGTAWAGSYRGDRAVFVGIIDTGVQFDHPDLAANVWTNPFDPADGVDNDGNGYIDDVHGWDFYHNDKTVYDGPAAFSENGIPIAAGPS